jgi:leucyl-tRNA synthetase
MSKSKKNVVDPNHILSTYGADTARWFVLSDSPPERDVQWTEEGIRGADRFLQRVWKLVLEVSDILGQPTGNVAGLDNDAAALRKQAHRATHAVGADIETLRFNRAVAQVYELSNALAAYLQKKRHAGANAPVLREVAQRLILMIAPIMPHLAETCWWVLGNEGLVAEAPWPAVDESLLRDDTVIVPIQVNGKRRAELTLPLGAPRDMIEREVLSLEPIARMLDGKPPKRLVIVPDQIVNVVV